jgi:hypothetical protein
MGHEGEIEENSFDLRAYVGVLSLKFQLQLVFVSGVG